VQPGRSILVASIAFLAGCNSDSTTPVSLVGQLGFAYAGALSGNFSANGHMPLTTTDQRTIAWAAGERAGTLVFVTSSVPRTASTFDIIFIGTNRTTPGSSAIDGVDTGISLLLGANVNGTGQALQTCFMFGGTVTITEISAARARGTFSATGDCSAPGGGSSTVTVTNGTFDVPFLVDIPR
jgi:hypothetical protein